MNSGKLPKALLFDAKALKNVDQVSESGYYKHYTQSIHINIEEENLKNFLNDFFDQKIPYPLVENFFRCFVHELRHWVDMHCTYGGLSVLEHILRLRQSLLISSDHARIKKKNKVAIWNIRKNICMSKFIEKNINNSASKWGVSITKSTPNKISLKKFEHFSVVLIDASTKKAICKSPIYLGSMMETNAVWQELSEGNALNAGAEGWPVERARLSEEFSLFVYNPNFPEYYGLAHLIGTQSKNPDIYMAFKKASAISTFILMMPEALLNQAANEIHSKYAKEKSRNIFPLGFKWPRELVFFYIANKIGGIGDDFGPENFFELLPCWNKLRGSFFDITRDNSVRKISNLSQIFGGHFKNISKALIDNVESMAGQKTFNPVISNLKLPPIFLLDQVIAGHEDFNDYEDYYLNTPETSMEQLTMICVD